MFMLFVYILILKLLYDAIMVARAEIQVKHNNPYRKYRDLADNDLKERNHKSV